MSSQTDHPTDDECRKCIHWNPDKDRNLAVTAPCALFWNPCSPVRIALGVDQLDDPQVVEDLMNMTIPLIMTPFDWYCKGFKNLRKEDSDEQKQIPSNN